MQNTNTPRDEARPQGAVLICGPTASGKSALALSVAREFNGIIINADSMQVYAGLRILTSRPAPDDEAQAPHRLYGIRPARAPYSAALWLADVKVALAEAAQQGWLPILVGGTGLYFKALTEGFSEIPPVREEIRAHYRLLGQTRPSSELYDELVRRDPLTAARLRPSDPQRIIRALEVLEATGQPLAYWQAAKEPPLMPLSRAYPIAVTIDRDELYCRCDARFDQMLMAGAMDEVRALDALGLDPALPVMRAVGLPQLLAYIRGDMPFDEAVLAAKTATRNYAKRQRTWIRGNFQQWNPIFSQDMKRTKHEIEIFSKNFLTGSC